MIKKQQNKTKKGKAMLYGLIGEHLTHSYSCEIHKKLADYDYQLKELAPSEVDSFMEKRSFKAINVTIPYKEKVIPHLDFISDTAKKIGAVNTVVNRDGKLYGYNTDFAGMTSMLNKHGIILKDKKVLILGTGGTCKTALAVANALGAREVLKVSRSGGEGVITYDTAVSEHTDAEVIINTTPVGMFSRQSGTPIDISLFPRLTGVVDAIYNPLRTELVMKAMERGIPACGGLYMLASQAAYASALFLDKEMTDTVTDKAFSEVEREKENVVLIGMPSSGKSSVGKEIAKRLGREFYDSDNEIVKVIGMSISEYFEKNGEAEFRKVEKEVISELSKKSGCVIATGGGAVLDRENVMRLKQNGRVFFLDRSLQKLVSTSDRPLSSSPEALKKRYAERYPIYSAVCDERVNGDGSISEVANIIIKDKRERN